ncbi:MAG: YggS family pyridoxal phosphate-dependent enzyme, partial [Gammaproteobacteria bacterium]
ADTRQTRGAFAQLRDLRDSCRERFGLAEFDQLSMGMSDDFKIAIEEGSTMVRIGTRIFGQRKKEN